MRDPILAAVASATRTNSLSCKLPASYSDSSPRCGTLDTVPGVPAQGVSVQDRLPTLFLLLPLLPLLLMLL